MRLMRSRSNWVVERNTTISRGWLTKLVGQPVHEHKLAILQGGQHAEPIDANAGGDGIDDQKEHECQNHRLKQVNEHAPPLTGAVVAGEAGVEAGWVGIDSNWVSKSVECDYT